MKPFKTLAVRALLDINRSASPRVLYPIKRTPARVLNSRYCILYIVNFNVKWQ